MFKKKVSSFFTRNSRRDNLSLLDGRQLVSEINSSEEWASTVSKTLKVLDSLSSEDYQEFLKASPLSYREKVLLFDILSLFNSIEVNLNRVLGLKHDKGALLASLLNDRTNLAYQTMFETDIASNFREILKENIEIRHLIAHGLAKRYAGTDSIVFITSNKDDWERKVKKRRKNPEKFLNREDSNTVLNEMGKNVIITPIVSISSLEAFRSTLVTIENHFSNYAALETR